MSVMDKDKGIPYIDFLVFHTFSCLCQTAPVIFDTPLYAAEYLISADSGPD